MIPNPVFSAFSFIGFCFCVIPLPWHLEAWNTGTCMYMFWTALGLLNQFINSIVWNGNAINWSPVWCDISTRITLGVAVAIPASSLCINRRLYHIACVKTVTVTKAEKRRAIMVDLSIGLGIPVLQMALQYIVQGHRFNIYEYYGCFPWTYNTPVAIPVVTSWPIVIGCVSLVYSSLTIRAFMKRRSQFKELLSSAGNNLNSGRYLRLMLLAGIEIVCTVPIASFFLYLDVKLGINPWISWADTHSNFGRVDQVPAVLWRRIPYLPLGMELSRWLLVACAFIFFGFFGFADEARKNYRLAFDSVAKRVGYSTASMSSGMTSSNGGTAKDFRDMSFNGSNIAALPRLEKNRKRDSFDSFDGDMSLGDAGGFLNVKEDFSPTATSSGSSTAASLPPSADDSYSFSGSHPNLSRPEPAVNRSSVIPHSDTPELSRSTSRAGSIDMV